ncbi:FtsP/CotA-like multicopper oxidase with cupredoxin domain [Lewinella aquimaris]|uniref:FtsP/CotA-like multicopper oxidase with cupredoxin domain n=1 Tax=Neolewinella aquimaris TaxID=1835722 RepID=A0A840E7Z7_9BACT|nr:multicopper oxidase domain-containing protein [Neolewinella aquimaris]MBB4079407.1 FtsP/CotA-like multicopper oxidase with cupredoxin domain [Neolewinella aquimaris]
MKWTHFCLPLLLVLLSPALTGQQTGDGKLSTYEMIPGQSLTSRTGKVVTYHLAVSDTTVNFTGNPTPALATNGSIPAPTLAFTEGDSARIYVTNYTGGTVSFHWHGLLLPNEFDGVPLLNTELIQPGATYVAAFPIIQHGTYWYHSHTEFQEQKGMYGPIVIQPKAGIPTKEKVVVLSDFTEQNPHEVLRQIKRHTDWYAIKRTAVQSYGGALATGNLGKQIWLEWNRMPSMDLADVYYNAFLANGKIADAYPTLTAGETIRLRVINGSASSHFWLQFAGGKMTVVSADGQEVAPVEVDKLLIATAETYDIEVTLPTDGRYEFRATSWDRYKHTSVWLGQGAEHAAPTLPKVDYFALTKEMKDMMAAMPDMQMGKAPNDIPEPRVYPIGEAPSNEDIQMESMMQMGMEMGMDHSKMNHDMPDMKHDTVPEPKMDHDMPGMDHSKMDHGKMNHDMPGMKHDTVPEPKMDHDMPGMDHSKMDHSKMNHDMPGMKSDSTPAGKTISAKEMDGKTMDTGMQMGSNAPMGVMLTGYYELKEANPNETIFDYNMLRSEQPTVLKEDRPVRVVHLYLGGNMLRYVWMINNQPLSAADKIMIEKGENVRFVFHNTTMMSHPMHLHGHFFRVVNNQGDHAPLKHTVNVAPMETTIIEFAATEDKDWFFHCHLLYHMMSGMARIIGYEGSSDLLIKDKVDYDNFAMDDLKYFGMASVSALSNGTWADLAYFNLNKEFSLEGETDYDGNFEVEGKAMRYLDPRQFFSAYVGAEIDGEREMDAETGKLGTETKVLALAGVRYFLPMMIWSDLRVDHRGRLELQLEREDIPLTTRWRASAMGRYNFMEQRAEYAFGTSYQVGQYWAVVGIYDSDYGLGGGIKFIW